MERLEGQDGFVWRSGDYERRQVGDVGGYHEQHETHPHRGQKATSRGPWGFFETCGNTEM